MLEIHDITTQRVINTLKSAQKFITRFYAEAGYIEDIDGTCDKINSLLDDLDKQNVSISTIYPSMIIAEDGTVINPEDKTQIYGLLRELFKERYRDISINDKYIDDIWNKSFSNIPGMNYLYYLCSMSLSVAVFEDHLVGIPNNNQIQALKERGYAYEVYFKL